VIEMSIDHILLTLRAALQQAGCEGPFTISFADHKSYDVVVAELSGLFQPLDNGMIEGLGGIRISSKIDR
jgi:hypothetical protein